MAIPTNTTAIGGTTKKSQYDALYNNAILCDTGGTPGGAQSVPGLKTFTDGINIDRIYSNTKYAIGFGQSDTETWDSTFFALEGVLSAIAMNTSGVINLVQNGYYDGAWKYKANGVGTDFRMGDGAFNFYYVTSGTANNPITWVKYFQLDCVNDKLNMGGAAGGSNRDFYIYFASDAYFFWDESETEINFIGANNFEISGDNLSLGGYAGGSNRDFFIRMASDAWLKWTEAGDYFFFNKDVHMGDIDCGAITTPGVGAVNIGTAGNYFNVVNAKDFTDRSAIWLEEPNQAYEIIKNLQNEETTGFCANVESRGQHRLKYSKFPAYCWDDALIEIDENIDFKDGDIINEKAWESQNRQKPNFKKGDRVISKGEKTRLRIEKKTRKNEITGNLEEYNEISIAAEGFKLSAGISVLNGAVQKLIINQEAILQRLDALEK